MNNVGYCCSASKNNTICSSDGLECSRGAANRNISYAYCPRSTYCNSDETIYATYEEQFVRATGFTYNRQRPCYWKITTNMSDVDSSDVIKIVVKFAFASKLNGFIGSDKSVATN